VCDVGSCLCMAYTPNAAVSHKSNADISSRHLTVCSVAYYYLLRLSSFYFPDHCKCYLFSLVTPVHSVHV